MVVQALEVDQPNLWIMPTVRRSNRNNDCKWICGELAESGFAMCSKHISVRRKAMEKLQARMLRASGTGPMP